MKYHRRLYFELNKAHSFESAFFLHFCYSHCVFHPVASDFFHAIDIVHTVIRKFIHLPRGFQMQSCEIANSIFFPFFSSLSRSMVVDVWCTFFVLFVLCINVMFLLLFCVEQRKLTGKKETLYQ